VDTSRRHAVFEYHGWITLWRTPAQDDDFEVDMHFDSVVIAQVRAWLNAFGYVADLHNHNGMPMVWLQGHPNHCLGLDADLVALYRRIGDVAPGSYGLLYMRDDEAGSNYGSLDGASIPVDPILAHTWRLFVLKRGQVEEREDPFFSPHVPTVEDPWLKP